MTRKPAVAMMRIAIAGGGGFAALLARALSGSGHALLVLSRTAHPEFEANYDCQVAIVDYHNPESLRFTLEGVDLVISTIPGVEQLNLIDASRKARVRTFVPSEFEGALGHRPPENDPFDNGSSTALGQLRQWSTSRQYPMRYTVFSCGVFYERFAPGGLGALDMGGNIRLPNQGDYMIDVGSGRAEIPSGNAQGREVQITMTSAFDVARFVAAAIELGTENWPREFKMRGARATPRRIQQVCSEVRQIEFEVTERPYSELVEWFNYYRQNNDEDGCFAMQHFLQTVDGRYTFGEANLNGLVNFEPVGFTQWLQNTWGPAQ
ncbi:putative isoflavone reductase family protein [Rosellinia necatrix]|uniref:Putative isoflavone reductase family protein n=1 Tax=Rosellinia necatrix TaxID=77044 RepID=A0A1S7UMS8_ROSNE|nr:putative isoflavone reductase family protein [Rosellinia necatrix]